MHYILYGSIISYNHFANILKQIEYKEEYICYAQDIYNYFIKELIKENLLSIYELIDLPLSYILFNIENIGIEVDIEMLKICSHDLDKRLKILEQKIYQLAGEEFNINSPKQLSIILFDKLNLNLDNNKKKYSTDIEILEKLKDNGILIAEFLIKWRELSKLKNTYTTGLQKFIINNKIHTTLDQTGTATGRLSSYNPNLQNIPIKSQEAENLRNCFISGKDKDGEELIFISSDYSQIELRLLAIITNSNNLLNAFAENKDIHLDTAAKIFNIPHSNITKEQRQKAKTINFGIIYGMGQFGLAKKLNISNNEAKLYIERFFAQYPEINKYMEETILFAKENGFVKNMFGRKCYLQTNLSSGFLNRAAVNFPIQSSASDIIKAVMIRLQNKFIANKWPIKCVLQVHDELIFITKKKYQTESIEHIKHIMQIDCFNNNILINDLLKDNINNLQNIKSIPISINIAISDTFFFNK
ncbi:MAG: DNA polymerase [Rickettsiales bacterium]